MKKREFPGSYYIYLVQSVDFNKEPEQTLDQDMEFTRKEVSRITQPTQTSGEPGITRKSKHDFGIQKPPD